MIRLFRNAACDRCARKAALTDKLDWFGLVETTTDEPPTGMVPFGRIVVQDLRTRELYHGIPAVQKLCMCVPLYMPFGLLLFIPAVARWAEKHQRSVPAPCELPFGSPRDLLDTGV